MKKNRIISSLLICFIIGPMLAQSPLDKRIDKLVNAMTTQEKIDQMINVRTSFGGTAANLRLGIPGFVMGDGPHGVRFTADAFGRTSTAFPTGIAMAATWDESLIGRVGEAMGIEFWSFKRNQALGPCLDLARDSRGGRTAESGGEDPYLAGHMAKAMVNGIQKYPVVATLKHFMGETKQVNRLKMNVTASQRWLMDFSGYNFRIAMQEAGVMSVMGAYNKIGGSKCSENSLLLKTILRGRWGFPFYVVSDWASIDDARNAVRAGTDICMGSSIYEADLPGLVENKFIMPADLDVSVKNILRTKILSGMLDYTPEGSESNAKTKEISDLNLLTAKKSVILLKNELKSNNSPILPISKTGIKIALIGPNAMAENLNCYGSSATNPPYAVSMKTGLENKIGTAAISYAKGCDINSTSQTGFQEAKTLAAQADVVIFAGGLDDTQEGEGYGRGTDRVGGSFALPAIQQTLINELAAVNPNIVVVLQSGGVCTLNNCLTNIKGLVYSFYAAQEAGNAIADVIFGDYNPAGRMPLSMPMQDSDFPSWEETVFAQFEANLDGGYRWLDEKNITPRYAFGYGLSYTTFEYSNLVLPTAVSSGQPFTATVQVRNTGTVAGEEVVQLYISAPTDKVWMPKKELRGFQRIALEPGETKTVTFNFSADDFYYWSEQLRRYLVPVGDYTFRVGGSSDNLPLSQTVTFNSGDLKPDLRITHIYTMPRYPKVGDAVSFYALVKNQGNVATSAQTPYNLNFKISNQNVASATQVNTVIAAGQVQLIASTGEWVADAAGKMTLTAQVGYTASNVEWDSNNNSYETDFEIFDPQQLNSELKNLAYLKNVTVSSEVGKYYGNQVVDGDLSTRWDSEATATESVLVDLNALCDVEKINLYWDTDYAKKYTLEKSIDGVAWTEIKNNTAGAGSLESFSFDKFEARYIRLSCTERKSGSTKYSLREIQVFGFGKQKMPAANVFVSESTVFLPYGKTYIDGTTSTNSTDGGLTYHWDQVSGPVQAAIESPSLPLTEIKFTTEGNYVLRLTVFNGTETGYKDVTIKVAYPGSADDLAFRKKAIASSSGVVTMYPQAAVDGNDNTRWASAQKNGEWWQIDLQHQVKPSLISMLWHNEYAKKYNIQISANGSTWQTYATNDAFTGGTSTNTNTGDLSGRYIRVNCVERSGQWENSIKTFKLYGSFTTNTNQVPVAKVRYYKQDNYYMLDAQESSDADNDGLTYTWLQITGPAFVTIENPTSSVARVSGLQPGSYYFKVTADDKKDIDFKILHVVVESDAPQAVSKISDESGRIEIYPNPAKDHVSIKTEDASNAQIKIMDVNGREVFQQSYAGDNCIKIGIDGLLSRGVYFVKVIRCNKVSVKKLIVS